MTSTLFFFIVSARRSATREDLQPFNQPVFVSNFLVYIHQALLDFFF
jgi:hypothetical protein